MCLIYLRHTLINKILLKMKKVKLVFGLLMLAVFSLSFALNANSVEENDKEQAIEKKRLRPPTNG